MTQAAARLRFVAGKGGVGRTTVAAARSLQSASAGRRTLCVDATGSGDLARRLSDEDHGDRLTTLTLDTADALDHYLSLYLPLGGLTNRVAGGVAPLARIFDYVANAAPGVREILVVGKIGWEALNGGWDEVVVDAPATGHLIELLDAPRAMAELVSVGPVADQSAWLSDVLGAATTSVELVTTLSELPVNETIELAKRVAAETQVALGPIVINRIAPLVETSGQLEADRWDERRQNESDFGDDPSLMALATLVGVAAAQSASAVEGRRRLETALSHLDVVSVPEIVGAARSEVVIDAVREALNPPPSEDAS